VYEVLDSGLRTRDIATGGVAAVGTAAMGDAIVARLNA